MVRIKSGGRFGFSGATVLVVRSGDQVSFNTTEGGDVLLKDKLPPWLKICNSLSITERACPLSPNSDLPAIKGFLNDRLNTHK